MDIPRLKAKRPPLELVNDAIKHAYRNLGYATARRSGDVFAPMWSNLILYSNIFIYVTFACTPNYVANHKSHQTMHAVNKSGLYNYVYVGITPQITFVRT